MASLMHWPYACDTSLDAHWRQLQQFNTQKPHKIKKKLNKTQKTLKSNILSRTSRNWYTDPVRVIHQSMRIDVSYNHLKLKNLTK
jgi:hypothetical protein